MKVVNTGLATGLVLTLTACGNDHSSAAKTSPQKVTPNQTELAGTWINSLAEFPLITSYESPSGVEIEVAMTPSYTFSATTFTYQLTCTFSVLDQSKTLEAVATAEIIPLADGFEVRSEATDLKTAFVAGELVACGDAKIKAGTYTLERKGDLVLMTSPDDDGEVLVELLRPLD